MRRITLGAVALGASLSLVLAGCSSSGPDANPSATASDEPLNFTIIYGVTGALSSFVGDFIVGAETAADAINAAGGVDGRQIELTIVDDKSDPTYAVSALTDMIDSGDLPDVLFPGGTSAETLAMLPVASEAGLVTLSSAVSPDTNRPDLYPFHFGTSPSQQDALAVVGQQFEDEGYDTVGVLIPGNASGDARLIAFQELMDDAGVEVVQIERPAEDALTYDVELQRIKDANPDAVYFDFNPYDANARILQSRVTVGATDIPIFGGISAGGAGLQDLVDASALEECYLPVFGYTVDDGDLPEHLAPLYEAADAASASTSIAAYGWDFVQLAALAVERTGGDTSAQSLTDALLDEPIPAGVLGVFGSGATYTADDRFPGLSIEDMTIVPCGADQDEAGIWLLG